MSELGRYSVLEGLEFTGKTTQIGLAREYAESIGRPLLVVREPGGTPFGHQIRDILLHSEHPLDPVTEAMLFMADRHFLWHSTILPALQDGTMVLSDRNYLSMYAYQGYGGQNSIDFLRSQVELVMPPEYLHPAGFAVLSLSKQSWATRRHARLAHTSADRIEVKENDFFERVREGYEIESSRAGATTVPAEQSPEAVFNELRPILFGE